MCIDKIDSGWLAAGMCVGKKWRGTLLGAANKEKLVRIRLKRRVQQTLTSL